jgi:hypothetical protein
MIKIAGRIKDNIRIQPRQEKYIDNLTDIVRQSYRVWITAKIQNKGVPSKPLGAVPVLVAHQLSAASVFVLPVGMRAKRSAGPNKETARTGPDHRSSMTKSNGSSAASDPVRSSHRRRHITRYRLTRYGHRIPSQDEHNSQIAKMHGEILTRHIVRGAGEQNVGHNADRLWRPRHRGRFWPQKDRRSDGLKPNKKPSSTTLFPIALTPPL